jgi:hypothetical protein
MMALAPRTVQNMPERLSREPITVLHPASITPEPNKQILLAEFGIAHSFGVPFEVVLLDPNRRRQLGIMRRKRPQFGYQLLDLAVIQKMLVGHYPPPFSLLVAGVKFAAEIPEVLASVIEIYNLDGAGELLLADVPDPIGTVAHDHLDLRPIPAALMRFGVDPAGELGGRFDGPSIGSGPVIAYGPPLVIGSGLREDAAEFSLAGVARPSAPFPFRPSVSLATIGRPVPSICT